MNSSELSSPCFTDGGKSCPHASVILLCGMDSGGFLSQGRLFLFS